MSVITLTHCIALASLCLSLYVAFRQTRMERHGAIKAEIVQGIRDLKALTQLVSESVIDHITFASSREEKGPIYLVARKADSARRDLEQRLPCRADEVMRRYTAWWTDVSSFFPVEEKSGRAKPQGAEAHKIREAQKGLYDFLEALLMECHRGRLKIK